MAANICELKFCARNSALKRKCQSVAVCLFRSCPRPRQDMTDKNADQHTHTHRGMCTYCVCVCVCEIFHTLQPQALVGCTLPRGQSSGANAPHMSECLTHIRTLSYTLSHTHSHTHTRIKTCIVYVRIV